MKRKVVQHGAKTLTISLPAEWVKRNNIHVGDELEIEESPTRLEIQKDKKEEKKEITIEIKEMNERLFPRLFGNLYGNGYTSIIFRFPDKKTKEEGLLHIQKELKRAICWEIIEQKETTVRVGIIASLHEEEFFHVLRRHFLMTLQIAETFADILNKKKPEEMEKIVEMEQKQDSLTIFCVQVLHKTKETTRMCYPQYLLLIERLEEVGDEYGHMAKYIHDEKLRNISKETRELVDRVNLFLREIYDFYYDFDITKIAKITAKIEDFEKLLPTHFFRKNDKELPLVHFLCSAFTKVYEISSPIGSIQLSAETKNK